MGFAGDDSVYSISGHWDPTEGCFAVLNTETPRGTCDCVMCDSKLSNMSVSSVDGQSFKDHFIHYYFYKQNAYM